MLPDLFKRLKPLYGHAMDQLWIEYQIADEKRKREIEETLTILAVKRLGISLGDERIVLEPPSEDVIASGDYAVGHVSYPGMAPYQFRLERKNLLRHVFILGPTGTGKSTLIIGLLKQFLADRTPFMVFDFKRNYRCLLKAEHADDLVVLTVGREIAPVSLNVLTPPAGMNFGEWAEALADIISTAYLLLQGARNVLKEALLAAQRAMGDQATVRDAYERLVGELNTTRGGSRRYGWLESSARSLEELSKGGFGKALNNQHVQSTEELLGRPVVFELEGLGDDQKKFFCLYLLQSILLLRKNQAVCRELLRHVLVFDESHNIFPKDQYGELSVASRLAREVREYGEGIIAATQQSDVADSLIANAGIKIVLRCDFPRDVDFASRLMQMEPKWFPKIALGTAIVRLPVRHYNPFLITFEEQPSKNVVVTNKEVHTHWERTPVAGRTGFGAEGLVEARAQGEAAGLSEREHALLVDIAEYPIATITERYQRLGWNTRTGNTTKDAAINKGFAYFEDVSIPTGRVRILSLTQKGRTYLRGQGAPATDARHGGATHEYWRHQVKKRLEAQGYAVTEEFLLSGGNRTDLCAQKDGQKIFAEIETGKSNVPFNIEKCRNLEGRVLFFFTTRQLYDKYEPVLRERANTRCLTPGDLDHINEIIT